MFVPDPPDFHVDGVRNRPTVNPEPHANKRGCRAGTERSCDGRSARAQRHLRQLFFALAMSVWGLHGQAYSDAQADQLRLGSVTYRRSTASDTAAG